MSMVKTVNDRSVGNPYLEGEFFYVFNGFDFPEGRMALDNSFSAQNNALFSREGYSEPAINLFKSSVSVEISAVTKGNDNGDPKKTKKTHREEGLFFWDQI